MPTDRQRIENSNVDIDKILYNIEKNDIKRDDVQNIEKILKAVKNKQTDGENVDPLELVTLLRRRATVGEKEVKGKITEAEKNQTINALSDLFTNAITNNDLNRFARYNDYRIVDGYISQVALSIDVLRDSIISPDNISKKVALYFYDGDNIDAGVNEEVDRKVQDLFKKYNFTTFVSEKIRETLVLGDGFTIVSSLSKKFQQMLNEGSDLSNYFDKKDEGKYLTEDTIFSEEDSYIDNKLKASFNSHIIADKRNNNTILESNEYKQAEKNYIEKTKKEVLDAINKNVKFVKDPFKVLSDGGKYSRGAFNGLDNKTKSKLDINGVYFRDIQPEDMIKLEIDHVCIGYLYINRINQGGLFNSGASSASPSGSMLSALSTVVSNDIGNSNLQNYTNSSKGNKFNLSSDFTLNGNTALEYEALVDMIVKGMAAKVDNKFIEKNESARDIIMALVKTDYILNKQVEVTFLEPDMVHHLALDSRMTYGKSVLASSLFYLKLYLATLITNMMVKINQGRDRRVFYVESDIDGDMEGNIERLIRDIKSREVPSDLFSSNTSISTVLGSVGSLDNYFIPVVNGNRAFDIDILSGVSADIDDTMMENLLKNALSGIGVPYNYIDATNDIDFARSLSMQNQGFVKKVVLYQSVFGDYFTDIFRKMYELEYGKTEHDKNRDKKVAKNEKSNNKAKTKKTNLFDEDKKDEVDISRLFIRFAEPIMLAVTTHNEQIDSTNTTIEFILNTIIGEEDDDNKELYRAFKIRLAKDVFLRNMDWDLYEKALENAKTDQTLKKSDDELLKANGGEGEDGEDDSGGSSW